MDSLTHTVGGDSNLVSFKSAARVPIESLKCHFAPIQDGEGDPSPENVRPIRGWNGVEIYKTSKNIAEVVGYSAVNGQNADDHTRLTNSYGTTINMTDYVSPYTPLVITQSQAPHAELSQSYYNGYIGIYVKNLIYGEYYDVSFKVTDVTNNLLNRSLTSLKLLMPNGSSYNAELINDNILIYRNVCWYRNSSVYNRSNFEIRICGISFTLSEFMVTPVGMNDGVFEPYCGETIPITFPTIRKNLFNFTEDSKFNNMEYINGIYQNTDVDTRTSPIYVIQQCAEDTSYIASAGSLYSSDIGRTSFQFTINQINCKWIRFKHNGSKKDLALIVPWPYGLGTYTISFTTLSADPTTIGGYQIKDIQIEVGNTATEYEPYNPDNTVYGGYIDIAAGEVQPIWCLYTLTGDESFIADNSNTWISAFAPAGMQASNELSLRQVGFCTHYPYRAYTKGAIGVMYNERTITFDGTIRTAEEWKAFCKAEYEKGTPVQICYPLRNYSQSIPIQKNNIITFLNQNNIWSNTNNITEVSYAIHDSAPIRAAKHRIAAAEPHIESTTGAITTFETDMKAPIKECKVGFEPIQDLHGYSKPWIGGAGKNLLKISSDNRVGVMDNATETDTGFDIGNNNVNGGYLVKVKPNTTYTYSYTSTYNGSNMHGRIWGFTEKPDSSTTSSGTFLINKTSWTGSATFTTDENTNWIVAGAYAYNQGLNSSLTNMQVEEGSVATSYEPYENICPIEGWNGVDVTRCGKNLFDISEMSSRDGVTVNGDTFVGSAAAFRCYTYGSGSKRVPLHIPKNVSINISCTAYSEGNISTEGAGFNPWFCGKNVDDMRPWYTRNTALTSTLYNGAITPTDDIEYYVFGWYNHSGNIWHVSNMQFEIGSEMTEYEPYIGATIPITFPSEAGTVYGGYIDLIKGEIVQTYQVINLANVDPVTYGADTYDGVNGTNIMYYIPRTGTGLGYTNGTIPYSDKIKCAGKNISGYWIGTWSEPDLHIWEFCINASEQLHVVFDNATVGITQDMTFAQKRLTAKTWLQDNPITFIVPLETPIHYSISPQTLKTLRGTNNIWSNANGNIELSYWKH